MSLHKNTIAEFAGGPSIKLWAPFEPGLNRDVCLHILDERTRAIASELRTAQPCPHGYVAPKGGRLPCSDCECQHGVDLRNHCKACEE